jgi:hypothetical protein
MPREKAQAVPTVRPKVPMRRLAADCSIVVRKRGNARGAKEQVIAVNSGQRDYTGGVRMFRGRRQPSRDGTSRITRECHVRTCERLAVKFPPGRRGRRRTCTPPSDPRLMDFDWSRACAERPHGQGGLRVATGKFTVVIDRSQIRAEHGPLGLSRYERPQRFPVVDLNYYRTSTIPMSDSISTAPTLTQ